VEGEATPAAKAVRETPGDCCPTIEECGGTAAKPGHGPAITIGKRRIQIDALCDKNSTRR
jgi:hypothetical protein